MGLPLLYMQTTEIAQFDDLPLLGVNPLQQVERVIQRHHVHLLGSGQFPGVFDTNRRLPATALGPVAGARIVDEDLAHQVGGHGQKLYLAIPAGLALGGHAEPGLVDQRRRLQRVVGPLAAQTARGEPAEFLVKQRNQDIGWLSRFREPRVPMRIHTKPPETPLSPQSEYHATARQKQIFCRREPLWRALSQFQLRGFQFSGIVMIENSETSNVILESGGALPMAMTVLSAILGLFSPLVFMVGAGSLAMALYLALCQFLVARSAHSAGRTRAVWSSNFVAMIAPVPVAFLAIVVLEKPGVVLDQGVPMLLAGCTGCLAGALAARWAPGTPGAYGENVRAACRIALRVNGGLTILVAAALFFVIGRMTDHPSMVIAVFHLLLAGCSLWRTRSAVMPIASGVFGLVFGLFLLFLASVSAHNGPLAVMYACAASDLLTGCSAIAVAIVGRGEPAALGT
jgi:hypothetical protein